MTPLRKTLPTPEVDQYGNTVNPAPRIPSQVRPIASGECLRRLIGKYALTLPTVRQATRALQPLQVGVGVPGAAELVAMSLQSMVDGMHHMAAAGDWVVLQVDVANAFNTVDRNAVLPGAVSFSPAMYPWLRFLYEQPAHLICQGQSLLSRTGVHQGCPLGPAAFAVGLHSAALSIKVHGLTWGVFYLDDGVLVGPASRVREAFRSLRHNMSAVGLTVNKSKCVLWGPGCPAGVAFHKTIPLAAFHAKGMARTQASRCWGSP